MNRALPEMLNTAENCADTLTVLERQRARFKWQQDQLLYQQQQQQQQPFNGMMDYGAGFPPSDHLTGFPGFMSAAGDGGGGGGLSLVEMVMGAVKPDPGLEDGWSDPSLLLNPPTAYELNSSLSRTSSCPPAVNPAAAAGRESFKKRKAEKVQKPINNKEKKIKASSEEEEEEEEEEELSKTTDQNSTKNNNSTTTTTTTNNNRETSADTSKASEVKKPDYIHVRARRGQATDSHSLAERVSQENTLIPLLGCLFFL